MREALLQADLRRVVLARAVTRSRRDAVELREGTDELRARDGRAGESRRQEADERIGHLRADEIDRRLIA